MELQSDFTVDTPTSFSSVTQHYEIHFLEMGVSSHADDLAGIGTLFDSIEWGHPITPWF